MSTTNKEVEECRIVGISGSAMKWFIGDAGISNLRYVWPCLWSLARPATLEVIAQIEKSSEGRKVFRAGRVPDAEAQMLASSVEVGTEKRLTENQKWLSSDEFRPLGAVARAG